MDSYNEFVRKGIPEIVRQFSPIQISGPDKTYFMHLGNVYISLPQIQEHNGVTKHLYPAEARIRNITYASSLLIDIKQFIRRNKDDGTQGEMEELEPINHVTIGKLPIMLQSDFCLLNDSGNIPHPTLKECEYDMGGYFIINGTEKALVGQERMCDNRVYVWKQVKQCQLNIHINVKSDHVSDKYQQPKTVTVKITSKDNNHGYTIKVGVPQIKQDIPLIIVFRALGMITDKDIVNVIVSDINDIDMLEKLRPSIEEARDIRTQEEALDFMSKYALNIPKGVMELEIKRQFILDALEIDLFPHLGNHSWKKKSLFLGYMVNRLLSVVLGRVKTDDRDHYANKRIDSAGSLMAQLFRAAFTKLHKDIKVTFKKVNDRIHTVKDSITKIIKPSTIDNTLKFAMASW